MNNGYVYVASMSRAFYKAAVQSADSLKDFYPDAKITLFTHPEFFEERDRKLFDNVHLDAPYHTRAKMQGMSRTPYEQTLYLDADTEIRSEKIRDVFDILGKNDIMFTKIIPHVSKNRRIDDDNELTYHGGIILFNNKPLTMQLMNDWFELYKYQVDTPWKESKFSQYDKGMNPWDQFTIWYLLHREPKYKKIKHALFPDGGTSYNFIYLLEDLHIKENVKYKDLEQIIYHYTIPGDRVHAGRLKDKP
jgi:hypothetical protein